MTESSKPCLLCEAELPTRDYKTFNMHLVEKHKISKENDLLAKLFQLNKENLNRTSCFVSELAEGENTINYSSVVKLEESQNYPGEFLETKLIEGDTLHCKDFETMSQERGQQETSDQLPCPECRKLYNTKQELSDHMDEKHTTLVRNDNRYYCNKCPKSFAAYRDLKKHVDIVHENKAEDYKKECPICHLRVQQLKTHIKQMHEDKNSEGSGGVCMICHKTFASEYKVKQHVEMVHKGLKRYQCELCPKKFYDKADLGRHVRGVHMGEKVDTWRHKADKHLGLDGTSNEVKIEVKMEIDDEDTEYLLSGSGNQTENHDVKDDSNSDWKEDMNTEMPTNIEDLEEKKKFGYTVEERKFSVYYFRNIGKERGWYERFAETFRQKFPQTVSIPNKYYIKKLNQRYEKDKTLEDKPRPGRPAKSWSTVCDECGFEVKEDVKNKKEAMRIHKLRIHQAWKECPDCGKKVFDLVTHQKSHLPENERPFKCEQCGKGFAFGQKLREHCKNVHRDVSTSFPAFENV